MIHLKAANNEKVYYVDGELWLAHGQDSGITMQLPNTSTYITNKKDDDHYNNFADKLVKWSNSNKPIKQIGDAKLYSVPVYPVRKVGTGVYDCWGGTITPISIMYMVIENNGKYAVINFFGSKAEAAKWVKSLS
jgi:hypothetical protein